MIKAHSFPQPNPSIFFKEILFLPLRRMIPPHSMNLSFKPFNVSPRLIFFRSSLLSLSGDLFAVLRKLSFVLLPRQSSALLHQWDLWGPLFLITSLAILLQSNATKESDGVEFAQVFLLMLFGAIVVTVREDIHSELAFSSMNI